MNLTSIWLLFLFILHNGMFMFDLLFQFCKFKSQIVFVFHVGRATGHYQIKFSTILKNTNVFHCAIFWNQEACLFYYAFQQVLLTKFDLRMHRLAFSFWGTLNECFTESTVFIV